MRFPEPPRPGTASACCALALRPAGFTSRDLRHYLAPQLGKTPEDMTSGQISYDLRRLRAHQIIERIPHSRSYQVTAEGLSIALFLTRVTQRVLIPGLAQLTGTGPPGSAAAPGRPRLQGRDHRLAQQASSSPDHRQSRRPTRAQPQESHTPQLDSKFRIPAGKDNLR